MTRVDSTLGSFGSLAQQLRIAAGISAYDISYKEQLYTYESVSPDLTICLSYLCVAREIRWLKGTVSSGLFPLANLPELSESDRLIIRYARERLHAKALYTTLPGLLLPSHFSLADLQLTFEALVGRSVDKRNFRKKITQLGIVSPLKSSSRHTTGHYQLVSPRLQLLDKPFSN